MRTLTRTRSGAWRRSTRGAAFLWTILVALPLMFFGLAMAVDFTRIVLAGREMATATHAAALAGAYQFTPGKAQVSESRARAAATETMCVSFQQKAIKNAVPGPGGRRSCAAGGSVSLALTLPNPSTVEVTTTYRLDGLLLMKYFDYGSEDLKVTRTAAVCNPADKTGPTSGYRTRPNS